jgi:tripartite-type tricarboxylate transporter receptor subunit TctC
MRNPLIFALGALLLVSILTSFDVYGANYPNKPIELIVPYGAGGGTDVNARTMVARAASYINNQPIVVVNKAGAGTALASRYVLDGRNDGYTLYLSSAGSMMVAPALLKTEYSWRNFVGIAQTSMGNDGLYVKADSPFNTTAKLIEYGKQNPGKIKYSTAGAGSTPHLNGEGFGAAAGIQIKHIPTKSDAEAATALLGGHVEAATGSLAAFQPQVDAGKLVALGQFPQQRDKAFPQIPTLKEQGVNTFLDVWRWIVVPKGVPPERIKVLSEAFKKILLQDKDTVTALEKIQCPVHYLPPEEYEKVMKESEENIQRLFKIANL